jgi:hypothetical protein
VFERGARPYERLVVVAGTSRLFEERLEDAGFQSHPARVHAREQRLEESHRPGQPYLEAPDEPRPARRLLDEAPVSTDGRTIAAA